MPTGRVRVRDEFHELVRRGYRSRRALARIIIHRCLEILPHYRGLSDSLLAEVRKSVLHHIAIFYRVTLETGRPLSDEDLEPSREVARTRAGQGVPLGEFLTFFHVGLTTLWRHLMDGVGESAALRAHLLDRVGPIMSNQSQLMTALTEAYVERRERQSRFREQDLDDFFQLLLAEDAMESVLEARARNLGVALDQPHAVAIFPATGTGTAIGPDDLQRQLGERIPEGRSFVGRSREGLVTLLPDPDPEVLTDVARSLFGDDARVGIGGSEPGVAGARRSADEARRALRLGAILSQPKGAHRYADLAVLDLVGIGSADARDFVRRVLGPLALPAASRTYLETLRQLSRNGYRIKLAAGALSVHPNTLSYRLKQLRRRFGIDLDDPEVRLRVHLAVLILDAQRPASDGAARGPGRPSPRPARS